ncbi:MAG: BamA/TamA family outer membrane protein [Desulfohalobiaceae bacterium]
MKWKIDNFRGLGEHLSVDFKKRNDEDHSGGASWYIPWFLGRRLRFNLNIFNYRKLREPESNDFIKARTGAGIRLGFPVSESVVRQLWFFPSVSLEERESRLSIPENVNYPAGVFFRQSLASTGFSFLYDSRNRNIVPTSGVISNIYMLYVHSLTGLEQNYAFYQFTHRNFIPVTDNDTFILGLDIFNRDGDLPSFFLMRLGGDSDLRGYNSEEKATSKILGSFQWRKLVFGPREYSIPWIGRFDLSVNLTAFVDTGALTDSFDLIRLSDFHSTAGGGIEIVSPFQNLIRLEYAGDTHGHGGLYFVSSSRF